MATAEPGPSGKTKTTATSSPTSTSTSTTNAVQRHTYTNIHTPEHTDFLRLPFTSGERTPIPRHDVGGPVPSTSSKVVQQATASSSHSGDTDCNAKSESDPSGARGILASSASPYPSSPLSLLTSTSSAHGVTAVFGEKRPRSGSYWLELSPSSPQSRSRPGNGNGDADEHTNGDNEGDADVDECGFDRRRLEPSSSLRSSAEETLCGSYSSSSLSQKAKAGLEEEGVDDFEDEDYEEGYHYRHRRHRQHSKYIRALCDMQSKIVDFFKRNTGLLLVTASQVFLSLMNVAVKKLNGIDPPVPTLELVAVRMIITYICCMAYMLSTGVPDPYFGPKGVRLLLVTRGSVGFFGLFGVYYSLQYLSLSDATVLTFLAPMCTAIAGALLLGEKFTKREAFAGIVSLVGVVLIARPTAIFGEPHRDGVSHPESEKGTPQERLVAVGVALIGVLGATGAYTSIRAIGKRAHPLHSMVFFSAFCVFISTTAMIANKTPLIIPTRLDWLALLFMIGIFGFVAQTLLTMGLQRETAGRGSMAVYTQIVFATVLERIFFHAVPTALSVIGTVMIISSALYVALTKENEAKEDPKSVVHLHRLAREDEELEEGLLSDRDSRLPPVDERGEVVEKPRS